MTVLFDERDVRVHSVERVIAMTWHDTPREVVVKRMEEAIRDYHDAHSDGAALIVVPFPSAPDERARNALHEMTKRSGRSIVGAAVLLALAGLRGKVLRGVVNGVIGAMSLPFPVTLVESRSTAVDHALTLLRKKHLEAPTAQDVEAALELISKPIA
jgi:hypothetical protein